MIDALKVIPYAELSPSATSQTNFDGHSITITTAPEGSRIDVTDFLRDPNDFHGPKEVDHIINFGQSMSGLIGIYDGPSVFFDAINNVANKNINVLAETSDEALQIVRGIDELARQLIEYPDLYNDKKFCKGYYDLAAKGYRLLESLDNTGKERGIPVSLIRAGLVTTRLAHGLSMNAVVPNEVQVETKRFHPLGGNKTDISVTVRWIDFTDPSRLQGKAIEIADFVNPASWASTAALLIALKEGHDVKPSSVMHRSFMGTEQGVALAQRVCGEMGIEALFNMVGITDTLDEHYYLSGDVAVGDAGQALTHFKPDNTK